MKSNLKMFIAVATLITAAAARAEAYSPNPAELHGGRPATVIACRPASAIDYDVPEVKSTTVEGDEKVAGSGSGEPRGSAAESLQESDFLKTIWTSP